MKKTMGTVARCRVQNADEWSRAVTVEVRGLLARLGADGWGFVEIAVELNVSRTCLYYWRVGAAEMPASKLLALRALVAAPPFRKVSSK